MQFGDLPLRFARDWSEGIGDGVGIISGKVLCRSFGSASQRFLLHLVHAPASHSRPVPGQVTVGGRSNGTDAMPALLDPVGATVIADAMHTQRSTAQAVTDQGNRGAPLPPLQLPIAYGNRLSVNSGLGRLPQQAPQNLTN